MALTHLEPARGRSNLTVRGQSEMAALELPHGRAVGVRLTNGDVFAAGEVIVCGGTYATPQLLQRSGINWPGLAENLSDHAPVSIDLPYVGPGSQRTCPTTQR